MLVAVDVHYEDRAVVTACVGFASWQAPTTALEWVHRDASAPAPYEPGQFYKRELPHVLRAIAEIGGRHPLDAVVVDAHVWLDAGKPGLGGHLHAALGGGIAVVGVAKTAYKGGVALAITRGQSRSPLFVTAAGVPAARAAELVRTMHGPFRLPDLLKRVDQLARGSARPDPAKPLGQASNPD